MMGLIQYHQPVNMSLVHDFVREIEHPITNRQRMNIDDRLDNMQASYATRAAFAAALIIVESGASLPISHSEPSDPIVTEKGDWSPLGISCLES